MIAINSYDEYGIPGSANLGRFQYTGQMWLPEVGLYYYKARMYSPTLGRFMQTDPIGFEGGMNLYGYTGNDPVNAADPSGLVMAQATYSDGMVCKFNIEGDVISDMVCNGGGGATGGEAGEIGGYVAAHGLPGYDSDEIVVHGQRLPTSACDGIMACRSGATPAARSPSQGGASFAPAAVRSAGFNSTQHYCGEEGGQSFPDGSWGRACYNHDNCYATMGADKSQCDLHLLQDIMIECSSGRIPSAICAVIASWYYLGVNFGGTGAFNRSQKEGK